MRTQRVKNNNREDVQQQVNNCESTKVKKIIDYA